MSVKKAGVICGNPTNGLCVRECIEVKKVLDGCKNRIDDVVFIIPIPDLGAPFPFRFVSARSNGPTRISNVAMFHVADRRTRVTYDATIPMEVVLVDASGVQHSVQTAVGIHRDVILYVPSDSLTPYNIEASSNIVATSGVFESATELVIHCCVLQVSKITANVDILVPSYGYCEYPMCGEADSCEDIELPLFPPFT